MSCLKGENSKLNIIGDTFGDLGMESNGFEGRGQGLIDFNNCVIPEPEVMDLSKPEPELELIDFKDFSISIVEPELMDFSKPEPDPELINFKDFSKPEFKTTDFSDPEPEFEYFSKPKAIENDMFLRICSEKPEILIKEIGSKSNDKVGISLFPNL